MKKGRLTLVALGVLALTASALGVGVALGSGSSHVQSPGDKSTGGAVAAPRSPSPTKPKSQAYVHFLPDGTIVGSTKKVIPPIHHTATGRYCVTLASSIHVHDNIFLGLTVDYFNSSPEFMVAMEGGSSVCTGLGFPNSVRILTDSNDTGAPVAADIGVFLTIP